MTSNIGRNCRDHAGYGLSQSDGRYYVTPSRIGLALTQNDPWIFLVATTAESFCQELLIIWATITLYIQSLAALAMLTTDCCNSTEIRLQTKSCEWRLIMKTPIVHEIVFKFPRKTSPRKQCSMYYSRLIHQLIDTNWRVALPTWSRHLSIYKIGTVAAGCHRTPSTPCPVKV